MAIQSILKSSRSSSSRRGRVFKTVGLLLLAFVVWFGYNALRAQKLKAQGQIIGAQAQKFKTDYYVGSAKQPELTYLVLGDSTAAGWGADKLEATYPYKIAEVIAKAGYRVHVVNFAVGGATLADVCQRQLVSVWTAHPDFITVSVGANDATRGTSAKEFGENLRLLLSSLENSDVQTIFVANTPDMSAVPALPWPTNVIEGARARQQNQTMLAVKRGPKVQFVDLFDKGRLDYGKDQQLYAADLFHPSSKGYARWADLYIEKLNLGKK